MQHPEPAAVTADPSRKRTFFYLVAILCVAAAFRFLLLGSIPPGIHPDAAVNGLDAWTAQATNHFQVFYEANNGREGLFINLIAFSFKLFGPGIISYKLPGALIGVFTVLGMYFFGKEFAQKKRVGLLASCFTAIAFWLVLFDRTGLRATLSVCCAVWASFFFLRALRKNAWWDYAFAGLFLGAGLNSYIAFRFFPLVLVTGWVYAVVWHKRLREKTWSAALKRHWKFAITVIISAILVLPLGQFFAQHPEYISARASEVSVFGHPNTLSLLAESIVKNLGMFTFYGDPNWRHNLATLPTLDALQAVLFFIGIGLCVRMVCTKRGPATVEQKTNAAYLLTFFLIMLLPAAITNTPGGLPHALRSIDTAPAVYLFVALGWSCVYEYIRTNRPDRERLLHMSAVLILVFLGAHNAILYFSRWGHSQNVAHEYSQDFTRLGSYLHQESMSGANIYLVQNSTEVDFYTLGMPHLLKAGTYNAKAAQTFGADLVAFSNARPEDAGAITALQKQGWYEVTNLNVGAGNHAIRVFSKVKLN